MSKIWQYFLREEKTAVCNVCKKRLSLGHIQKKKQTTYNIKNHLQKMHPDKWRLFQLSTELTNVTQKRNNEDIEISFVDKDKEQLHKKSQLRSGSKIWEYFAREQKTAVCNVCNKKLSLGHSEKKKQTTKNIKNHLEKMHPETWQMFVTTKSKNDECKISIASENKSMQITSTQALSCQKIWPDDHPLARKTDKLIMDLIIVDMLPFSIVEGAAFQMLNFGNPTVPSKYRVKSANYFKTTLMPETYEKVMQKVVGVLNKAKWISITTNICNNICENYTLLSLTAHLIDGPKRVKVVLGVNVLQEQDIECFIADMLAEAIDKFQIEQKVHLLITDNAQCIRDFVSFGCIVHALLNILDDCVLRDARIENIIKKCRLLVEYFNSSEEACQYLYQYQEMCDLPKYLFEQHVVSTWSSTFLMLERMLAYKSALNRYAKEHNSLDIPSLHEWKLMEQLVAILQPFYEALLDLSHDSACVSIVIPLISMLRNILQTECEKFDEVVFIKTALLNSVNNLFTCIMTKELMAATFLDPRFKTKYFLPSQVDCCKNIIYDNAQSNKYMLPEEKCSIEISTVPSASNENSTKTRLWDLHDSSIIAEEISFIRTQGFIQQIQDYLMQPVLSRDANIYQYWYMSSFEFLKIVALQYLSAPPSSVAQLYSDRRSSLLEEKADQLLFLAHNIKLLNFEY